VWHDSFTCVTNSFISDMPPSPVLHDTFTPMPQLTYTRLTWFIHTCDLTHLFLWRTFSFPRHFHVTLELRREEGDKVSMGAIACSAAKSTTLARPAAGINMYSYICIFIYVHLCMYMYIHMHMYVCKCICTWQFVYT